MLSTRQKLLDRENNILSAIMFAVVGMFILTLGLRSNSYLQESLPTSKSVIKNVQIVNATDKKDVNVVTAKSADSVFLLSDISHYCQKKAFLLLTSASLHINVIVNFAQYASVNNSSGYSCQYVVSKTSIVLII